jgi:hypothetical protein
MNVPPTLLYVGPERDARHERFQDGPCAAPGWAAQDVVFLAVMNVFNRRGAREI